MSVAVSCRPAAARLGADGGGCATSGSSCVLLGALLIAWAVAGQLELVNPFLLPPLGAVLGRLVDDVQGGDFALNAGLTFYRTVVGFAIACVIGVPLGILVARRPAAALVLRAADLARLPDAEDRLPADLHPVVRGV